MTKELYEEHIAMVVRQAVYKANWDRQWALASAIGRISHWGVLVLGTAGNLAALVWLNGTWAQRGVWLAIGTGMLASHLARERCDALLESLRRETERMLRDSDDWLRRAGIESPPQ